ncbi:MAG TPA: hypothetical protein VFV19_10395 [Candidatus Polarisedimenticolaceae bacterium]|nr:hypothetical protein [Candidatus Polarisedimenticolaceae bacterium]
MHTRIVVLAIAAAAAAPALAQTSASYKLTESIVNNGGDPVNGASGASASHRIKLDALGDGFLGVGLASASFHMDGGFVDVYPPPGEVQQQLFTSKTSMVWNPERSVGQYEVYRDALSGFLGGGTCFSSGLTAESATDAATPAAGQGYFYLVTARNRLGEEGTKGLRTSGVERPNPSPCP